MTSHELLEVITPDLRPGTVPPDQMRLIDKVLAIEKEAALQGEPEAISAGNCVDPSPLLSENLARLTLLREGDPLGDPTPIVTWPKARERASLSVTAPGIVSVRVAQREDGRALMFSLGIIAETRTLWMDRQSDGYLTTSHWEAISKTLLAVTKKLLPTSELKARSRAARQRQRAELPPGRKPRIATNPTYSEKLFASYLVDRGIIDFEANHTQRGRAGRVPDFTAQLGGMMFTFEVKEFANDDREGHDFTGGEINGALREKINQASQQLASAKEGYGLLVVYPGGPFAGGIALSDPLFAFAAMLGDLAYEAPVDTSQGRLLIDEARVVFSDGGKMVDGKTGRTQNTSISALCSIGGTRNEPTMTIYENPLAPAERQLPRTVFRDPRDRRFAFVNGFADPRNSGRERGDHQIGSPRE